MIRQALLVFENTPAAARQAAARVAGLSLLDRQLRTLARAGIERLEVLLPPGSPVRLSRLTRKLGLRVELHTWGEGPVALPAAPEGFLLLLGDHVHHHSSLKEFLADGLDGRDLVVQVSDAPALGGPFRQFTGAGFAATAAPTGPVSTGTFLCTPGLFGPQGFPAELWGFWNTALAGRPAAARPARPGLWQPVADRRTARAAKDMLFGQVTKQTSGPISRHLNARISIPISKLLVETGLSPHLVTVLLVLTSGLGAAYLMSQAADYTRLALAGTLWQLAAILDRCDGEIARVKLCESKFGAWFDTVTDNLAYICAYVAVLVAMDRIHPDAPFYTYLGISALAALLFYLVLMYIYAWKSGSGSLQNYLRDFIQAMRDAEQGLTYRLIARYAYVAKRDFFSFVIFVAALANALEVIYWFLVVGLHLLVVGLLVAQEQIRRARQASQLAAPPSSLAKGQSAGS